MRRIKSEGTTTAPAAVEQSHPQQGPSMREPPVMTPPPIPPEISALKDPTTRMQRAADADQNDAGSEGETITVTWGEELYSPQQFFTFRVGPFSSSTKVQRGESRAEAGARVMRQLEVLAADERMTKMKIFLDTMGYLFATIKGAKA